MTIAKTAVAELLRRTKSISMAAILLPAAVAIIATTILTTVVPARASNSVRHGHPVSHHHRRRAHREVRVGTVLYHALLLEDADTGRIIYDYNGGIEWPPASMAKMMLLMVAEDQIKGRPLSSRLAGDASAPMPPSPAARAWVCVRAR